MSERRQLEETISGGLCLMGKAARILGVSANRVRDLIADGTLKPAGWLENGASLGMVAVLWRSDVEALHAQRRRMAEVIQSERRKLRPEQTVLPLKRLGW